MKRVVTVQFIHEDGRKEPPVQFDRPVTFSRALAELQKKMRKD